MKDKPSLKVNWLLIKMDITKLFFYSLVKLNEFKDWFIYKAFIQPYYRTKIWFKKKLKLEVYYEYTDKFPMENPIGKSMHPIEEENER